MSVDRPHAESGSRGDVVHLGIQTRVGERGAGSFQDARAVAPGVRSKRLRAFGAWSDGDLGLA
jgi:hypothetical protein